MRTKARQIIVSIDSLKQIHKDTFLLIFRAPYLAKNCSPGQFLHVKVNSVILRRPFSVHRVSGQALGILFRVRGRGTKILSRARKGDKLNVIGPLGRGFSFKDTKSKNKKGCKKNILIAGGVGVAPLFFLAQKLHACDKDVLLGAKTKGDVLCEKEFQKLGCRVFVATEDGTKGKKGTAIDLLKDALLACRFFPAVNIYVCGPTDMFVQVSKALKPFKNFRCEVSFEQFMGCGLGICCGCVIKTKNGYKKVCKDGPVFNLQDVC